MKFSSGCASYNSSSYLFIISAKALALIKPNSEKMSNSPNSRGGPADKLNKVAMPQAITIEDIW